MGLVHKISERPSGALMATGVTYAPGVKGTNLAQCLLPVSISSFPAIFIQSVVAASGK